MMPVASPARDFSNSEIMPVAIMQRPAPTPIFFRRALFSRVRAASVPIRGNQTSFISVIVHLLNDLVARVAGADVRAGAVAAPSRQVPRRVPVDCPAANSQPRQDFESPCRSRLRNYPHHLGPESARPLTARSGRLVGRPPSRLRNGQRSI